MSNTELSNPDFKWATLNQNKFLTIIGGTYEKTIFTDADVPFRFFCFAGAGYV